MLSDARATVVSDGGFRDVLSGGEAANFDPFFTLLASHCSFVQAEQN